MFQAARIKSKRLLLWSKPRKFLSTNNNGVEKSKIPTSTTGVPPKKPNGALVIGVSAVAMGSVLLVLNANNETVISQLDKYAPFVNTILKAFRPPVTTKIGDAQPKEVNREPKQIEIVPVSPKSETKPEVAKESIEITKNDISINVPSSESAVSNVVDQTPANEPTVVVVVEEDRDELYEQVEEMIQQSQHGEQQQQSSDDNADGAASTVIPEGVDKIAWLIALNNRDDGRFYNGLKELTTEELELLWKQAAVTSTNTTNTPTTSDAHNSLLHHELQSQARSILSELQNELHRQHERDLEIKYQRDLRDALAAQAIELENQKMEEMRAVVESLQHQLTADANNKNALIHKDASDKLMALQPRVSDLENQLQAFQSVTAQTAEAVRATLDAHRISSAVLALELALSHYGATANVDASLRMLRETCKNDPLVMSVIDSLPKRVLQNGALNSSELQVRFNIMRNEVRKVALAPEEAPKMVGAAIGHLLAKITWVPKGFLTGQGVEDALARADYFLERGRVKEALEELDAVDGYSAVLMEDFKTLARDRLVVDQSISVLKAKSIVRHKSFV